MSEEYKARKAAGFTKKQVVYNLPGPLTLAAKAAAKETK